jgi:GNAT superfamily N-acetyltransferase
MPIPHNDQMEIRRLESLEELFTASGGDFLLRHEVPAPVGRGEVGAAAEVAIAEDTAAGAVAESAEAENAAENAKDTEGTKDAAWLAADGTFAFGGPDHAGTGYWVTAIGGPETSAALLRHVVRDLGRPLLGASVPRGTDLAGLGLDHLTQWDFMVFDADPAVLAAVPGFADVEAIPADGTVDAELEEFLQEANPTASARPGWERIRVWGGVRDADGTLVAAGALIRGPGGPGHLASIGTRPAARGRGLGAAVTAWLTARALSEGDMFCGLGHWVPNETARRVYLRLGYRTTHSMSSGRTG